MNADFTLIEEDQKPYVTFAEKHGVDEKEAKKKWDEAEKKASEELGISVDKFSGKEYGYTMAIFKKMLGIKESFTVGKRLILEGVVLREGSQVEVLEESLETTESVLARPDVFTSPDGIIYKVRLVHVDDIKPGDIIEYRGQLRTVGSNYIKHSVGMGTTIYGDSFKGGREPVKLAIIWGGHKFREAQNKRVEKEDSIVGVLEESGKKGEVTAVKKVQTGDNEDDFDFYVQWKGTSKFVKVEDDEKHTIATYILHSMLKEKIIEESTTEDDKSKLKEPESLREGSKFFPEWT